MALLRYLTNEEKLEIEELKTKILHSKTVKEIKFYEKEIHTILDLVEERYYTDPNRPLVHR